MKQLLFIFLIILSILSTIGSVNAEDCENLNEQKICWENSTSSTLSWTAPRMTLGEYQIEARDFNWLGSISLRVSKNGVFREGVISEGESYIFDFTNNSTFEGIKIIGEEVSNIRSLPPNIGTYPSDPNARIMVKTHTPEDEEKPELELSIFAEKEEGSDSIINADIDIRNSGDSELVDTELRIFYDGLEVMNEYDLEKGLLNEVTVSSQEIKWQNDSTYKLSPINPAIIKNGFFIEVLNFSNKTALISISHNRSSRDAELKEGDSIIFDSVVENEYFGVKIYGKKLSGDSAELILLFPKKNSLKRTYPVFIEGSSELIKLKFKAPQSTKKAFSISATAIGTDREGNRYNLSTKNTLTLEDTFSVKKITSNSILGENLYPEFSRVGGIGPIKNLTYVTIIVENLRKYPVHGVKLTDSILPGFNSSEDMNQTSKIWYFDINPDEQKEFTYTITAKRQGVYNLPEAQLEWNEWGENIRLESNGPKTIVSGPYIVMERSFNRSNINIGDTVAVSLSITNNGDVPANIIVNDSVPKNATFLSGTLSFSGFLRPTENAQITYAVKVKSNEIEFKAPEMKSNNNEFEWYEPLPLKKISGFSPLPAPKQTTIQAAQVKATEQAEGKGIIQLVNEKFPWFEGAISIVTLLSGIFLLVALNKKKYLRTQEK